MSLTTEAAKSVSDPRILVQVDIGQVNTQWINIGAGIWSVNAENIYAFVDDSLLDGFSAQEFGIVGSVYVDGKVLTQADTLLEVIDTDQRFFYDKSARTLYIVLENYNEPFLDQTILIGVVNGYSFDEYTPTDSQPQPYEGRLLRVPSISISRDPLFFGRLQFGGGPIVLDNTDGEFDTWGETKDMYGNPIRIYFGYPDLDFDDYQQLYTGYIGGVSITEESITFGVQDRRKQLSRDIKYTATAMNALDAIKDIMTTYFPIVYNETYFDTTAWDAAAALVDTVSLNMQEPEKAINVIEQIALSVFGLLVVEADGRYSFKIVDTSVTAGTTIQADDILSRNKPVYDPTEVISSVRVGYGRDWVTAGTQYTYYTDPTHEASVFTAYKTYNQQTFDTLLDTLTAATAYATNMLSYFKEIHGKNTVEVPMKYYAEELGNIVNAEIQRPSTTMLGTKKSEVTNVTYKLSGVPTISFGLRFT